MVVEAEEIMKMEKNNQVYKIGVVEDKVEAEEVRQAAQKSSALNVGNMVILPRIVIQESNVIIMGRLVISWSIASLRERGA